MGIKNPTAHTGDTGLIPDPRRSHMPRSNLAHRSQLLSLRAVAPEACAPQSLRSATREAAAMRRPCTKTAEEPPACHNWSKIHSQKERSIKKKKKKDFRKPVFLHLSSQSLFHFFPLF